MGEQHKACVFIVFSRSSIYTLLLKMSEYVCTINEVPSSEIFGAVHLMVRETWCRGWWYSPYPSRCKPIFQVLSFVGGAVICGATDMAGSVSTVKI